MTGPVDAVVIGASAGALDALSAVLPALPADCPLAIAVVVHLPPDKKSVMAELMSKKCQVPVKEAEDKEPFLAGTIYFAPPDYHLLIEPDRCLSLSADAAVNYSRPAADVLFESAADAFGPRLAGVVLTGASGDGARGLRAVHAAGGAALVQDPATAYAATMPEAAIAVCPDARVLPLPEIAAALVSMGGPR